jgi:hypothetical protein
VNIPSKLLDVQEKKNKKLYRSSDASCLILICLFLFITSWQKNLELTYEHQLCVKQNVNTFISLFSFLFRRLKSSVLNHCWGKHLKFSSLILFQWWNTFHHFDYIHLVLVIVSKIKHSTKTLDHFQRSYLSLSFTYIYIQD